jgi:hypothetical protein
MSDLSLPERPLELRQRPHHGRDVVWSTDLKERSSIMSNFLRNNLSVLYSGMNILTR